MKRLNFLPTITVTMIIAVLITACASESAYKAADGSRYGYSDTRIAEDRYRVSFNAPASREGDIRDYALLRAAELTLLEGYDWFVVLDRKTEIERSRNEPSISVGASRSAAVTRNCGLVACRTYYHPERAYGAGFDAGGSARSELEIRLGKGVRPEVVDSFDAAEVRSNLRQSLDLESE
ncbi:MAG: hypothetical protein M0Q95_04825 [Porticoccaceae bacterium]|nr:hypothetical protein [Porticoccaceae bacterium]